MLKCGNKPLQRTEQNSKFYAEFLPMGLLGKAFGIFQFENTMQGSSDFLQHKWCSLHMAYGILLHLPCLLIYMFAEKYPWFYSIIPVFVLRGLIIISACIYYEKFILEIIRKVEEFDINYWKFSGRLVTPNRRICFIWMALAVMTALIKIIGCMNFVDDKYYDGLLGSLIPVTGVIALLTRSICINTYILLCYSLSSRFCDLFKQWKYILKKCMVIHSVFPTKYLQAENIEDIRILHGHLVGIVKKLNDCYGARILIFFAMVFFEILGDMYIYICGREARNETQVMFNCFNVIDIILMATVTTYMAKCVSMHIERMFPNCRFNISLKHYIILSYNISKYQEN